jgi:hypothetical protein
MAASIAVAAIHMPAVKVFFFMLRAIALALRVMALNLIKS